MSFRNQSVSQHQFSMVPRGDVPRSSFAMQKRIKTTFNAGGLVPILLLECLPGDRFNASMTLFARMGTLVAPIFDNLYLETFAFFCPNRLLWNNWVKFMGQQDNPGDSISYLIPMMESPASGYTIGSVGDYFGLPTVGQVTPANVVAHSALPFRMYGLVYNEWFRDQNLVNSVTVSKADGPDTTTNRTLLKRGKRHDYFTSALPFLQKGTAVSLPLGTSAPVIPNANPTFSVGAFTGYGLQGINPSGAVNLSSVPPASGAMGWTNPGLITDLSAATAASVNTVRLAFQMQKYLERDARGGTRYVEMLWNRFGVQPQDYRLQRPEYIGGGTSMVNVNPVASTADAGGVPVGDLAAFATALGHGHGFSYSCQEHGYIMVLANVRADLAYQQGLEKHWDRETRFEFYAPEFAMLGEQSILNKEIYATGGVADEAVFGYQERWAEYRYTPSSVTGLFRSTATGTLDFWHLAEKFTSLPALNSTFISDPTADILVRNLAAGSLADNAQFLLDGFVAINAARPLPLYSVPGMIDHF